MIVLPAGSPLPEKGYSFRQLDGCVVVFEAQDLPLLKDETIEDLALHVKALYEQGELP